MCTDRQTNRQTDRTTTVTLAAHARRGLMKSDLHCISLSVREHYTVSVVYIAVE